MADHVRPETRARCGKAARRDRRGGRGVILVRTATFIHVQPSRCSKPMRRLLRTGSLVAFLCSNEGPSAAADISYAGRWRGGVAACGACAADGDAGDRL